MATSIITPEDLHQFKTELLEQIKKLLTECNGHPQQRWLKSADVRKLLKLSPGTLQTLRVNGTLPYTKIGSIIFYDAEEVNRVLEKNKRNSPPTKS